jgi:hypothetical protein
MILRDLYERVNSQDELSKYFSDEYFVSFTSLPKIGLNPKSQYKTPIGIYTYPLGIYNVQTYTKYMQSDFGFPFAGTSPWVNVLKLKSDKVIAFEDASIDWLALRMKARALYIKSIEPKTSENLAEITSFLSSKLSYVAQDTALVKSPAGVFWNYSRLISIMIKLAGEAKTITKSDISDDIDLAVSNGSRNIKPALWTKVFLDIGIEGFIDTGDGIIHPNEPEQAVFFTTRAFNVVDRWQNEHSPDAKIYRGHLRASTKKEVDRVLRIIEQNGKIFHESTIQMIEYAFYKRESYFSVNNLMVSIMGGIVSFDDLFHSVIKFLRYYMKKTGTTEIGSLAMHPFASMFSRVADAFPEKEEYIRSSLLSLNIS